MIPLHTLPTRLGIEQGLRGTPERGPGRYDPDPVSNTNAYTHVHIHTLYCTDKLVATFERQTLTCLI